MEECRTLPHNNKISRLEYLLNRAATKARLYDEFLVMARTFLRADKEHVEPLGQLDDHNCDDCGTYKDKGCLECPDSTKPEDLEWDEKSVAKLSDKLILLCAIRLGAYATTGKYAGQNVPKLTFMDALKRWEDKGETE